MSLIVGDINAHHTKWDANTNVVFVCSPHQTPRYDVSQVTLDTHLTFTQHCNNIAVKVQQSSNILKALSGSTLGCYKETLLSTYKKIGRSIISCCIPVWKSTPMDTNLCRLQLAQNFALRVPTGCHKMADVTDLLQEARELPVRLHNELIFMQLAIVCHPPLGTFHQLCHSPTDERPERQRSLISRHKPNIMQLLGA